MSQTSSEVPAAGPSSWRPSLPAGYETQQTWGFRDLDSFSSYEFNHVYGPPDRNDPRGPVAGLDEGRSYWSVTWSTRGGADGGRSESRCLSYAQARKLWGSPLTFRRFSSPGSMQKELTRLLHNKGTNP